MKRLATLILAGTLGTAAFAQAWPTKPVRVVVPCPAGCSLDIIVRTMSDKLTQRWKQPIVVDNKSGGGGMIGMDTVAKATPDGYTLGLGFNGPIAFGPFMYKKMPYAPATDLMPIILTTSQPNVLAVPASLPVNNVQELVAWAKKQGDKVSYASVGSGSSSHLSMELFLSAAGIKAVHIPYKGSPPAALAVASGDVQMLLTVAPALLPLIQDGRIKLLGVTGTSRQDGLPKVPTIAESGYPGFEALAWNGLFAPAGTPASVIDKINADVNAVLKDPAIRTALEKQGLIPGGGSVAEFNTFITSEGSKWGDIIKRVGITVD
ncbi:MAG: tripartite tricarboxylate transporter substrate binding protein [Ramlibacter sp.]